MKKIIKDFIPIGRKNRPCIMNDIKYITIHNTGNTAKGSNAKNHSIYVKSDIAENIPVSWHYTVDDNIIYQHLPDCEIGFHAGDGKGNGNYKSIGIEICMNSDGNLLKATDNAVELVAYICQTYQIPLTNIKQHNDWSKKNCPQMIRNNKPYNWETFISKVNDLITINITEKSDTHEYYRIRESWSEINTQIGAYKSFLNAKNKVDELNAQPKYFVFDSMGNKIYPL